MMKTKKEESPEKSPKENQLAINAAHQFMEVLQIPNALAREDSIARIASSVINEIMNRRIYTQDLKEAKRRQYTQELEIAMYTHLMRIKTEQFKTWSEAKYQEKHAELTKMIADLLAREEKNYYPSTNEEFLREQEIKSKSLKNKIFSKLTRK